MDNHSSIEFHAPGNLRVAIVPRLDEA